MNLVEFMLIYQDRKEPSKPDFKINNVEFNDTTKRAVAYLVKQET